MLSKILFKSPVSHWTLLFIFVNLFFQLPGATNASSRFALLCAMVEDHSFRIDSYYQHTSDWARTPDGHTYSNKAPGPALLAFPVFWIIDSLVTIGALTRGERDSVRFRLKGLYLSILSMLFQVLPFAFLAAFISLWFVDQRLSGLSIQLAMVALLFGNTASLFMNTYFGHGMSAVWILALCLAFIRRKYLLCGFTFGWALLSDYGVALLLIPLLGLLLVQKDRRAALGKFVVGGVPAALLWIWYHVACFGSPLVIANKFQNPVFLDSVAKPGNVWGIIQLLPDLAIVKELLIGSSRGLLWTQPWLLLIALVTLLSFIFRKNRRKTVELDLFLISGLALLLYMNSAFGAWHGGDSPGPRYMSSILPSFALLLGLKYDLLKWRWVQLMLISMVAVSVLLYLLVFVSFRFVDVQPIWAFYLDEVFTRATPTVILRTVILIPALIWATHRMRRRCKPFSTRSTTQ